MHENETGGGGNGCGPLYRVAADQIVAAEESDVSAGRLDAALGRLREADVGSVVLTLRMITLDPTTIDVQLPLFPLDKDSVRLVAELLGRTAALARQERRRELERAYHALAEALGVES